MYETCESLCSTGPKVFKNLRITHQVYETCESLCSTGLKVFKDLRITHQVYETCESLCSTGLKVFKDLRITHQVYETCKSLCSTGPTGAYPGAHIWKAMNINTMVPLIISCLLIKKKITEIK